MQHYPTGVDSLPVKSRWGSLMTRCGEYINNVFKFPSVKTGLEHIADYGTHVGLWSRMKYIPLTVLMLGIASQVDAQCCGAQSNLEAGLKVGNTTNYTDFLSANDGWTDDGLTREGFLNFHRSVLMTEAGIGYGRLGQIQDASNSYTGDFSHVAGRVMLAGSSDRSFIPYAGVQGGYMHSQVEGMHAGVPYEYSGGRRFWGPVVGANVNFGEVFTVGIGAESKYFLTDPDGFEGIRIGKEPDSQGRGIYQGNYFVRFGYRFL